MSMETVKLLSLAADVPYACVGGPFGSKLTTRDYIEDGVPVIRGSNMNNGRHLDTSEFVYVSEEKVRDDLFGNLAYPNDLIFTQRGTLGQVTIVPEDGPSYRYVEMKLTLDENKANILYVYYYFTSRHAIQKILNFTSSSGVPHINLTVLRNFEIPLPPLHDQEAIADTLSTYDNLIENNRRRIQLLEQAARLLYKEWFVHLRFPGHEHVKIKDGVPEGWEKTTAFEVMEVLSGGTPKTKVADYWGGEIPFFTPKDATSIVYAFETEKYITEYGLKNCNSRLYPKDTLFITARGTVGKLNIAQTEMAMNQSCYALVAKKPLNQHFLYFALIEEINQFRGRAVGAVFNAIVVDTFRHIPFLVPDESLIAAFSEYVSPILKQIDNLTSQKRSLAKARDLLLPRLMNGGITV